jgi:MerR family transcriptional regulator, redox-sensitive transcriptional activator SoxR
MDDPSQLTIGEVAQRAGVATSAIRYYESIGLLPAPDRLHGHRRYDPDVVGTLAFVGVAQSAGFKLDEIRELMAGAGGEDAMGDRMRELSRRKLAEVEAMLEQARAMKGWLEVANACDCGSPEECSLFPAPGEATNALTVIHVDGCRRPPAQRGANFS